MTVFCIIVTNIDVLLGIEDKIVNLFYRLTENGFTKVSLFLGGFIFIIFKKKSK